MCVRVYLCVRECPALSGAEGNGLKKARQQSNAVNLETPFSAAVITIKLSLQLIPLTTDSL